MFNAIIRQLAELYPVQRISAFCCSDACKKFWQIGFPNFLSPLTASVAHITVVIVIIKNAPKLVASFAPIDVLWPALLGNFVKIGSSNHFLGREMDERNGNRFNPGIGPTFWHCIGLAFKIGVLSTALFAVAAAVPVFQLDDETNEAVEDFSLGMAIFLAGVTYMLDRVLSVIPTKLSPWALFFVNVLASGIDVAAFFATRYYLKRSLMFSNGVGFAFSNWFKLLMLGCYYAWQVSPGETQQRTAGAALQDIEQATENTDRSIVVSPDRQGVGSGETPETLYHYFCRPIPLDEGLSGSVINSITCLSEQKRNAFYLMLCFPDRQREMLSYGWRIWFGSMLESVTRAFLNIGVHRADAKNALTIFGALGVVYGNMSAAFGRLASLNLMQYRQPEGQLQSDNAKPKPFCVEQLSSLEFWFAAMCGILSFFLYPMLLPREVSAASYKTAAALICTAQVVNALRLQVRGELIGRQDYDTAWQFGLPTGVAASLLFMLSGATFAEVAGIFLAYIALNTVLSEARYCWVAKQPAPPEGQAMPSVYSQALVCLGCRRKTTDSGMRAGLLEEERTGGYGGVDRAITQA